MFDFIAHPDTGDPININSILGMKILSSYAERIEDNPHGNIISVLNGESVINDINNVSNNGENEIMKQLHHQREQELYSNTVILKSRNVSKYSIGQEVKNVGKENNLNGIIIDIIEGKIHDLDGKIVLEVT